MKRLIGILLLMTINVSFGDFRTMVDKSLAFLEKIVDVTPLIRIRVNAMGDTMMGTTFPEVTLPPDNGRAIFQYAKEYMTWGNPDIVHLNLEGPITDYPYCAKDVSRGNTFAFKMPPDYVHILTNAGVNIVTTGNNHAKDFGLTGYLDTRKHLDSVGIKAVGNHNEVVVMEIKGRKVAMIGFCNYGFSNNFLDIDFCMALIRKAKKDNDIVIITFHGGAEGEGALHVKNEMEYAYGEARGNIYYFCHEAVNNGADLVIGHGPHVPRGVELYKERLIAYSLGNFATYKRFSTDGVCKYSPIISVDIDAEGKFLSGKIIPMIQFEGGVYRGIPKYDEQFRTVKLMRSLSIEDFPNSPLVIADDGTIVKK